MASLTNTKISDTYPLLLKIESNGVDGTFRSIEDGDGTGSALQISTGGINVAGTITASGTSTFNGTIDINNTSDFGSNAMTNVNIDSGTIDGVSIDGSAIGAGGASTGAFTTLTTSGDVNFDSNTLFVDASENNVGIGTSTPDTNSDLNIEGSGYKTLLVNTTAVGGGGLIVEQGGTQSAVYGTAGSTWLTGSATTDALIRAEQNLIIATGGNTRAVTIDSSQRVGIGVTSPAYALDVRTSSGTASLQVRAPNDANARIRLIADDQDDNADNFQIIHTASDNDIEFQRWNGSAWRSDLIIDSSGNSTFAGTVTATGSDYMIKSVSTSTTNGDAIRISAETGTSQGKIELDFFNDSSRSAGGYGLIQVGKTSNAPQLGILASGGVGIGTNNPQKILHTASNGIRIDRGGGGSYWDIGPDATNDFKFIPNGGTESMRITTTGKVGIGETDPVTKLEVRLDSTSTTLTNDYALHINNQTGASTGRHATIGFGTYNNGGLTNVFGAVAEGSGAQSGFVFLTHNGGALTEKVRIKNNGSVGIGTDSPSEKLHVNDGDILVDSARGVRANGGNEMIRFDNSEGVKINSGGKHVISFKRDSSILHHSGGTSAGMELYKQATGSSANLLFTVTLNDASSLYHLVVCEIIIAHIGNANPRLISQYIWEIENHSSYSAPSTQVPINLGGDDQSITRGAPSENVATFQINGQGSSTTNIGAYFRVVSGVTGVSSLS